MVLESADDFGAALRQQREAAQRTLRELADATKLGVRTLEALERNQIDKLPPGIFRRAVVRAYAREVGLDPERTLRIFLARNPDDRPPPGPPVGPVADADPRPARISPVMLAGVVVAVLFVLFLALRVFGSATTAPSSRHTAGTATHVRKGF